MGWGGVKSGGSRIGCGGVRRGGGLPVEVR